MRDQDSRSLWHTLRSFGLLCIGLLSSAGLLLHCNQDPYDAPTPGSQAQSNPATAPGKRRPTAESEPTTPRLQPTSRPRRRKNDNELPASLPVPFEKPKQLAGSLLGGDKRSKLGFGNKGLSVTDPSRIGKGMEGVFGGLNLGGGALGGSPSQLNSTGLKLDLNGFSLEDDKNDKNDSTDTAPSSRPSSQAASRPSSRPAPAQDNGDKDDPPTARESLPSDWPPRGIVARVNDDALNAKAYMRRYKLVVKLWELQKDSPVTAEIGKTLRKKAMESLINDALLFQRARQRGTQVSEREIQQQLKTFMAGFPEGTTLQSLLRKTKMTRKAFSHKFRRQLMIRKYSQRLLTEIRVDPKILLARYKKTMSKGQRRVSHIVVELEENAAPKKRRKAHKRAKMILALAQRNGADFGALARKYSSDSSSEEGGDLGFLKQGDSLDVLDQLIFSMSRGEVRGPVRTPLGYHLVKLTQIKPPPPFAKVMSKLLTAERKKRLKGQIQKDIAELREESDIKVLTSWGK